MLDKLINSNSAVTGPHKKNPLNNLKPTELNQILDNQVALKNE